MQLFNKTIVITGGTSGVGLELVKLLSRNNQVSVVARSAERLNKLKHAFPHLQTFQADLSNACTYPNLAEKIISSTPKIDILINNAAVQYPTTFIDNTFVYENVAREINTNLTAICSLCFLLLPALKQEESSYILNINSGLALTPKKSSAIYCATKAALRSFSQSLRYQVIETNIGILEAYLPIVDTPMTTGRGANKISAEKAAIAIIKGLEKERQKNYIGKTRFLPLLLTIAPGLARSMMKRS
ncbi:SDR family oxidoreductase [Idiomarina sp. HP20-50]|uniref:SDR family oxidoreductase n=1 Tax=Idiomarina sp. HP20-50 TaxID=3070813 RepID=UPI00294B244A|nr:SDR family NAD(P)-dependent oxidoreductase [Idiomarina sp. HP20-50]MDV6316864.1 SDR family NAD(P)-dependent oxidoreductase [Idiomarina sp. HP20-50]